MANVTTDQHFVGVTLNIVDSQGRPATVDGVPAWASSDETVLTVTTSLDGMTGDIETVAPGTARISVTADADLGAGVVDILGVTEDIVVTLGASHVAAAISFNLGEPVAKA